MWDFGGNTDIAMEMSQVQDILKGRKEWVQYKVETLKLNVLLPWKTYQNEKEKKEQSEWAI